MINFCQKKIFLSLLYFLFTALFLGSFTPDNVQAQICSGTGCVTYNSYSCGGNAISGYRCDATSRNACNSCVWSGGNCLAGIQRYSYWCTAYSWGCEIWDNNTTTTNGCNVSCNPNSWGPCSAACGGGTQTNACGTTRACNTFGCCSATNLVGDSWCGPIDTCGSCFRRTQYAVSAYNGSFCGTTQCTYDPSCPNCNNAPTTSITSPTNGTTFTLGSNVTVNANAADSDGTVTRVDLYLDGVFHSSDTSGPYQFTITNIQGPLSRTLQTVAYDNDGAYGVSAIVNIIIDPGVCADATVTPVNPTTCGPNEVTNGSATWQWSPVLYATQYEIDIIDQSSGTPVIDNTWQNSAVFSCAGTCSYTSPLPPGTYYARIKSRGGCSESAFVNSPTSTIDACTYTVTGTVYEDPDSLAVFNGASGRCELIGASPIEPGSGTTVSNSADTQSVQPTGTIDALTLPGSTSPYLTTLNPGDPSQWSVSCPASGNYSITVGPNINNLNYFVTNVMASWFQVVGGDVHVNQAPDDFSLALQDLIPTSTCILPTCEPYLSLQDDLGTADSSGIVTYANGLVDVDFNAGEQSSPVDEEGKNRIALQSYSIPRETYDFFYRQFQFPLNPLDDWTGPDVNKPIIPPVNNNGAYCRQGDININNPWTVNAGEQITVFVEGDLNINNTITVDPGGSLIFIVRGNINIADTVGDPDPAATSPVVSGVFIADGIIDVQSNGGPDLKFIGDGTFVGWSGINLARTYDSVSNNTNPSDLFRFRPDFVINAPDEIKRSYFRWLQAAP